MSAEEVRRRGERFAALKKRKSQRQFDLQKANSGGKRGGGGGTKNSYHFSGKKREKKRKGGGEKTPIFFRTREKFKKFREKKKLFFSEGEQRRRGPGIYYPILAGNAFLHEPWEGEKPPSREKGKKGWGTGKKAFLRGDPWGGSARPVLRERWCSPLRADRSLPAPLFCRVSAEKGRLPLFEKGEEEGRTIFLS